LIVGAVPAETSTALYIAQQKRIFASHGLHVTIKTIITANDAVPDLLHGTMDIASGQVTSFISAQASGLGTFLVLASGLEMGPRVDEMVALGGSGISSPADLKGKTIAENASSGNGILLTDALLSAYDLKPDQVTPVVVPFADMSAALSAHRVQAAYCSEPYCTEMQQKGATVVADLNEGAADNLLIGGYTATAAWVAKYPRTAAAFAAAIDQASEIADTNLTADERAFEAYLGAPARVADVMATGTFPTSVAAGKLQQVADLMQQYGELKQQFTASVMVGNP
jgi:NitT/TauT family transport system substrate-binding protein